VSTRKPQPDEQPVADAGLPDDPGATGPIPVVLVMTVSPSERESEPDREAEMRSLLDTAGCRVVGVIRQHLQRPFAGTYIGSGKVQEVREATRALGALEVAFDVSLTPSQERNLEEAFEMTVVDYTALILHIFARNARTKQAMLAVELAQLEFNRSRLKRLWTHLDRLKAGTNMRGPGEKQLESDRRLIDQRILDLKQRLSEIEHRKERTIAARGEIGKVALVGYTNAGKSTLMNALTGAGVLAEDRLFATLDTRTARLELDRNRAAVISDTVGFIRNLPPALVASFHATLAEVIEADLLLHVVDASSHAMEDQIATVETVLAQIGAAAVPVMMIFNKADVVSSPTYLASYRRRYKGSVAVSARTGQGLDDLRRGILGFIGNRISRVRVCFPLSDGATTAFLHRRAVVLAVGCSSDEQQVDIEADERLLGELRGNDRLRLEPVPVPVEATADVDVTSGSARAASR
jgi:GTP-binding protein HflX